MRALSSAILVRVVTGVQQAHSTEMILRNEHSLDYHVNASVVIHSRVFRRL